MSDERWYFFSHNCGLKNNVFDLADKPGKPGAPLEVTDLAHDSCTLLWKAPKDDGGSPILHYVVERMELNEDGGGEYKEIGKVTECECPVKGLTEGKLYRFRVKAVNAQGESEYLTTTKDTLARDPWDPPDSPGPCTVRREEAERTLHKYAI